MVIDFNKIKSLTSNLKINTNSFSISSLLFFYIIILFTLTLLASGIITYFILKNIEMTQYEKQLRSNIKFVDLYITHNENKYRKLDSLIKNLAKELELHTTLADSHGVIVADSHIDIITMKNIFTRKEFRKAYRGGIGLSHRYSYHLKDDFLSITKKVTILDKKYVIILSKSTEEIFDNFVNIWIAITLAFAISFYIALLLIFNLGNKFSDEIDKILDYLIKIVNKDYSTKYEANFTKEFTLIANKIETITNSAKEIEDERDNYTSKLQHLSRQQGDILSAISHEFKNPIAAIVGYSQTLLDDIAIDKKIRIKFLKKIVSNANKLTNLIDKLSLSFRFEKGDLDINFESIDISKIVEDSTHDLLQKHLHRSINLHFESKPIYIKADRTFMQSVVVNLIDNALKYSEDDIDIYISTEKIAVKDNGIGIKEEDINNITKRFYRASKKSWDNSMGVGLFLVEYILKAHNIELEIESECGKGSTFSFSIENIFEIKDKELKDKDYETMNHEFVEEKKETKEEGIL